MKTKRRCLVVGIFTADSGQAETAFRLLKNSGTERPLLLHSSDSNGPVLCLEGEHIVTTQTSPANAQPAIQALRTAGARSVFVLSTEPLSQPTPVENSPSRLRQRLDESETSIRTAREGLLEALQLGHALSPSAEWLLDNDHLVRTQIAEVRRHLPRIRPSMRGSTEWVRYVRALELARFIIATSDCVVTESGLLETLNAAQRTNPLSIAELWVFPLLLRLVLIETLATYAVRVDESQQVRENAYYWADRLVASAWNGSEPLSRSILTMEKDPAATQPSFITCLAEQLQDKESALSAVQQWLETQSQSTLTDLVRGEHNREAAECVSISNCFGSLRTLARLDFSEVFEAVSVVEAELRNDPEDIYSRSDFDTRDRCRKEIERLSRQSRNSVEEIEVARRVVARAASGASPRTRHVGYYLLDEGLAQMEAELGVRVPLSTSLIRTIRRNATFVYIGGTLTLTACFLALTLVMAYGSGIESPLLMSVLGIFALFPLSELAVQIVNALVISLLPPDTLPKMDYEEGIPPEHSTLIVVPMMLVNEHVIEQELRKLEVRYLANPEENLYFSLFPDFVDAPAPTTASDIRLLQVVREGIERLNRNYPGGRFLLFHRPRLWSESEQRWIGHERKRGKIEELNALLNGEGNSSILISGSLKATIRYVITVDADTQLPPGSACRLIETIAHPLNRVEIDPTTKVRTRGYTIIQPRISIALPEATATRFTSIFSDSMGTDPYCQSVSDAQQDLFTHAIYHGKAIYDVRAFHTSLHQRFPEATLLSHDLIEGAHVGVGLATDIELFESMPRDYGSFSRRQHRWIRGDWQIAPWAGFRVPSGTGGKTRNPLSIIDRWRIFDNLRRSLVPVASMLLLLLGWLISAAPGVWSLVLALAFVIPVTAPLLERMVRRLQGTIRGWQGAADELARSAIMAAFMPHQAWLSVDAIARVLFRRYVSHKHLLEWQTAEGAELVSSTHLSATMRQLLIVSGLSVLLLFAVYWRDALGPTAPFIAFWIVAPVIMRWLARPTTEEKRRRLNAKDARYLRHFARLTWRYFDDLVNHESNWLPPDNSQLALRVEVAPRTSPTNIGLWLNALLAARDFGYITPDEVYRRGSATLATMHRMEQYEGHLLNWYDIRNLAPLTPRYVSTVDSGNMLASLWVLHQGCNDLLHVPIVGAAAWRGLIDTMSILREACGTDPSAAVQIQALRRILRGKVEGHVLLGRLRLAVTAARQLRDLRWVTPGDQRSYWAAKLAEQVESWIATVDRYLGWMEVLTHPPDAFVRALGDDVVNLRRRAVQSVPSLHALAEGKLSAVDAILSHRGSPDQNPETAAWLDQLATSYRQARANAAETVKNLRELSTNANQFANGINMGFLFDGHRALFGVGYTVGDPHTFNSHYDLLASECRVASLVSIAKGDVPVSHWFALGRPRVTSDRHQRLLSWSGTMFEYLMPLLFTKTVSNSLLDHACRSAVECQIEYGNQHDVPWGVSECAYSALDNNQVYQYKAFGVPQLSLQREVREAVVVAPYATMLALPVDPPAAIDNLKRLETLGLAGPMGFYEAIDFTRESKRDGDPGVVIYAYMSHHQGMSLLALSNILNHGSIERRFHRDYRIQAIESLLFERLPITKPLLDEAPPDARSVRVAPAEAGRVAFDEPADLSRTQLYGNGRYSLMLTRSGTGYSRWNGFDINRWRADETLDPWGSFLYLRDLKADTTWATTSRPVGGNLSSSTVRFSADRTEYHRRVLGIDTVMHVTIAGEDDAELRRVVVTNRSLRTRQLELTSYIELALAPHAADRAHPAFAKMFIETECPEEGMLVAHRRPRSPEDQQIWAAHLLVGATLGIQFETDRTKFLGRGNGVESPSALDRDLSGSAGTVLDPIFSLRCRLNMEPRERVELCFVTLAARNRDELMALCAKYRRAESITRAFEMAWTRSQLEFRHLGVGPAGAQRFQELASYLIYPNAAFRASDDRLVRNRLGQPGLWNYGISGDWPMISITASDARSLPLVREVLMAHSYWRGRGFMADLIILNQEGPVYDHPFRDQLQRQIAVHSGQTGVDRPGGVFLRDWHSIPEEHRNLILSASLVVMSGSRGSLQQQLVNPKACPTAPAFTPEGVQDIPSLSQQLPFLELPYFNGLGGFTADAREYAIYLKSGDRTPAPWVNVMSNRTFGGMVSESGLGCTWKGNSQAHRLTPWENDPLVNPQPEAIYVRDEETGVYWSPTVSPVEDENAYRARHGQGYTVFEHNAYSIAQELTVFVPVGSNGDGDPVKIYRLRLRNLSKRTRRLSVTFYADWVLGANREEQQSRVQTAWDAKSSALLARQTWTEPEQVAFAAASPPANSYCGDRGQFFGRAGSRSAPSAMLTSRLDNCAGPALDPCVALQCQNIDIEAGGVRDVVFLLGETANADQVRDLIERYRTPEQVQAALSGVQAFWDGILGTLQVRTPLLSTDFIVNRWLLYQTLSCRFWARTALYQSSGAFGFRDQLQDSLALVYSAPHLTRAHILKAASRQFLEGDVQHWWHEETGNGVRTTCSDDLLWLPYAVTRYVTITGDSQILHEQVPFLEGAPLAEGVHDHLFVPQISAQSAPMWEHCRRAIETGWKLGPHGIPLIGSGDWNDGMNRVGIEGKGESAWLAWFLFAISRDFGELMVNQNVPGASAMASLWNAKGADLAKAMEADCWDGEWYVRGFFDNGQPLGSRNNAEARIDSLPQSWAVISGAADQSRAHRAMESAEHQLVDEQYRIVKLFTPAFDKSEPNPGYIMGYPPGIRENGGQYTHGSLWLAMARARMGDGHSAVRLMQMMNPIERNRTPVDVERYRGEPYAVAADIYSAGYCPGRCGWTWYTGSASWTYRIWIEEILGFHLRGDVLQVRPSIPKDWEGFEIRYRYKSTHYEIRVKNNAPRDLIEIDGQAIQGDSVPLTDDRGSHVVTVHLGPAKETEIPAGTRHMEMTAI